MLLPVPRKWLHHYGLSLFAILLGLLLSQVLYAQSPVTIQGRVYDKSNPIPGATIRVEGTTTGATSDAAGYFKITASANATLLFTAYGFKPQTIPVNNRTSIDVIMEVDTKALDEVVVVGYGTQKKVNLTGAVATVKGSDLLTRPVTNPAAMLQGTMAGVQVVQSTGEPGNEGVSIRIRGTGTYSGAGVDPLVLIDGVEGKLTDLNPNNIENISVLKDAASASIYGARAANGVILVTTKQGTEGKMVVQYDGNYGIYKPTKLFKLITNSAEYMELYNEARINSGLNNGLYPQDQIDLYRNATDHNLYPNTDWLSLIFQTAPTQNHNLSFSGGRNGTTYNASIGYVDQQGIMKGFNYKKYNARLNITSQVNKAIRFGANIALKSGKKEAPVFGAEDMFLSAMAQAPTYSPKLADGSGRYTYKAYDFEYNNKNPIALLDGKINHNTDDYAVNAQGWFEVQITKHLSWYTKAAVNAAFDKYNDFRPPLQLYNFKTNEFMTTLDLGGGLEMQDQQNIYTNLYSYLNYERSFNGHNFKLMAGYNNESSTYQYLKAARKNFPTDDLRQLDAGSPSIQYANGTKNGWALMSYFGRLNYNFKDRYLLEANLRYDGSSRLTPASRWAAFPSFSAAWRVTEESFMKNLQLSWLDNLKLRGSWGKLGNQNIGNYPYQSILSFTGNYSFDDATLNTGVAQEQLANPGIRWETTTISDIGIDIDVLKGWNITADWYKKRTTDILANAQVTAAVGLQPPTINNGTLDNTGIELGLAYNHLVQQGALKGLSYTIGGTLEHYKNKLVSFGPRQIDGYRIRQEGQEYNAYYMLEQIGIFQSEDEIKNSPKQFNDATVPGDLKYKDQNGDGVINDLDRVTMSGNYPALNYSLRVALQWNRFDLSAMAQGVNNVKFYVSEWGTIPFVQGAPPTTDWRDRWTETNHSTTMPRIYWGWNAPDRVRRASSYYLQDASYLRLKNLTIGYTLPVTVTRRVGIDFLRVYFSGDNLFTATKYKGLDPERYSSGNFVQYPQNKIYSFGINVKF
ncbi:TonB-dependent receptor [Chitinophaga silvatica]|uniref:TonB-dependent receptor n=1 Tax=Chitinophaga silvatica TaxID=2282649 RepID=A0A3E1YDC6_9BACT|nr:TonB-dependent receptor [Chitinophaga silvatica]RFS24474.1 TonB-dependent receptor [Chitinophaga silvatica]